MCDIKKLLKCYRPCKEKRLKKAKEQAGMHCVETQTIIYYINKLFASLNMGKVEKPKKIYLKRPLKIYTKKLMNVQKLKRKRILFG